MWTLYGTQGSGSAAVEMALERCGLAYRTVRASTWESDSAQPELRHANPLGQIPTLVLPDGSVMTESAAMLIQLGLTYPDAALLPRDASGRAQAVRGLVFIAANCYSAISIIDYPERWVREGSEAIHAALRDGTRERLHRHWEIFADQFTAEPFLGGAEPGALDLLAAVVSRWGGTREHLGKTRPQLLAVLEGVERHPALAAAFARHWPR